MLWDGTYRFSSLFEKSRKSNHLYMSLHRQHFLLNHLKTLSVGPTGVWTHDLPLSRPTLSHWTELTRRQFLGTSFDPEICQPIKEGEASLNCPIVRWDNIPNLSVPLTTSKWKICNHIIGTCIRALYKSRTSQSSKRIWNLGFLR